MRLPRRLRTFATVGVLGFIGQIAALDALIRHTALPYPAAVALAVEGAILHNFLWHERWTWRDRRAGGVRGRLRRLVRFNAATAATSIAGNVLVTSALVEGPGMPIVPAGVAAVVLMSAINFALADRLVFRAAGLALVLLAAAPMEAADLSPTAAAAYDEYVRRTEERLSREAADAVRFLWIDFQPAEQATALRSRLRRGEIVALAATTADAGLDVPGGLIHHWRGYVFISRVVVDDLIAALRDPEARRQEEVLEARVADVRPGGHVLFLTLHRSGIVTATYNTEHVVRYARRGDRRATSRSVSRRIVEIERLDDGRERERPVGRDRGFLWRMNSYWRYEAVPGGVIVEVESITLSRDLPWGLGAVARPIIGRVGRESVVRTLAA
jgi:putative flippase GtrA